MVLKSYGINDLDDNGQLKPGFFLIVTMLLLSKQIFYGPVALIASRKGRGGADVSLELSWLTVNSLWEFVICLPAFFMVILLFKRKPQVAGWIKRIWHQGRLILLTGAALQLGMLVFQASTNHFFFAQHEIIFLLINLYLLFYLFTSQRVKDVFSMFPE